MLRELGAALVLADAMDPEQVVDGVARERSDTIVHELTAIGAFDRRPSIASSR